MVDIQVFFGDKESKFGDELISKSQVNKCKEYKC